MIFVSGGCGFIGANFILNWLKSHDEKVVNIDKLTYAGNIHNLDSLKNNSNYEFVKLDILSEKEIFNLLEKHKPRAFVHFAAESHVDRSILGPAEFVQTNVVGTFSLLQANLAYFKSIDETAQKNFRFLHVSTDEVYGSLDWKEPAFTEKTAYAPNSPYSASKAASDHFVRAYHHTFGLPTVTTNCSNNYGPFQFPEKLIPLVIRNALAGLPLPIYGTGENVRDWLYVTDHAEAIEVALTKGRLGETYNIGGNEEHQNIEIVKLICDHLDKMKPATSKKKYSEQIQFVKDRPGHDKRYAIDSSKIKNELGWVPKENFTSGLQKTIHWYLENQNWISQIADGSYKNWVEQNDGERK
jgi:dTDP-glucose 4,6-dehydratase